MEYINPLTGVIAILAISIITGVVEGVKARREKRKNPPPKKPVPQEEEMSEEQEAAIVNYSRRYW